MTRPLFFLLLSSPLILSAAESGARHGHFPYQEASTSDLAAAGVYRDTGRRVLMRPEAARAFQDMAQAALLEGVRIIPISGFRSVVYQEELWGRAVRRRGSEKAAARWVAPPGHSEHHTGWTLDLGDGDARSTDIETSFESTQAYQWLQENAARFHFELSFPRGNAQGVSYEPWHWRYIGADGARKAFSAARGGA